MINTILIFGLLQLGYNLLFKPKYTIFSCGLFGVATDDISKINIDKLKILGIYNDSRGGHSCGITLDGDIIYGTNKQKLFKDLISDCNIGAPEILPVVLGHTRMATGGTHDEYNAHPFGFGENKSFYHFIGTHNGTLFNHLDLAKKYGVSVTKEEKIYNGSGFFNRTKIDSEILLEIIYKNANFNVLEEYEGAAALAMYNTKRKNNLYLYHGASKKFQYDKELTEERPLFIYQAEPNLLYYSSIKESLEAINDNEGLIKALDCNVVYDIKNGDFLSAKKTFINRSNVMQNKIYIAPVNNIPSGASRWDPETRRWVTKNENSKKSSLNLEKINLNSLSEHKNWFEEKHKEFVNKGEIYFENLRFWKNKELLEGVYLLDNNMNLIHICNYLTSFDACFTRIIEDNHLENLKHKIILPFVKGILLRSMSDYNPVKDNYELFDYSGISEASVYPVRDISNVNSKAYFRGSVAELGFCSFIGRDVIKLRNGFSFSIEKKDLSFDVNKKYYLPEDLEIFNKISENNIKQETKKEKSNDDTAIELYNENIIATVDYCIDDTDESFEDVATQNKIKTALESIKQFINDKLKF